MVAACAGAADSSTTQSTASTILGNIGASPDPTRVRPNAYPLNRAATPPGLTARRAGQGGERSEPWEGLYEQEDPQGHVRARRGRGERRAGGGRRGGDAVERRGGAGAEPGGRPPRHRSARGR